MSLMAAIAIAVLALYGGAAQAHCGSCGVGEPAVHGEMEGHGDMHGHGDMSALPEGHAMQMPLECPGGCGMSGGLCMGCQPVADEMLRAMAVDFCPNCEETDNLCEMCQGAVDGAMDMLTAGMQPSVATAPAHEIAYMAGTLGGDMEGLFGGLMGAVMEQDLVGENTHVGSVIPFALSGEGFSPDTTVYAGVSLALDSEVADPLSVFEVPGGVYMMVDYYGPYEGLAGGWMATFAYAKMAGIELGDGPCGEHYVSDPETTPVEELLTQIFIPVTGHSGAMEQMDGGGMDDPHAGHGHG
jgi:effector-binding domain-containing protein